MKPVSAALAATAMLAALTANAQDKPTQPAQEAVPPATSEPYRPSLSEIMALQQMRHIKLWFAGRANNWPLANYEIGELNDGFDDVNDMLGGDTVQKAIGAQIAALQKAVDEKIVTPSPQPSTTSLRVVTAVTTCLITPLSSSSGRPCCLIATSRLPLRNKPHPCFLIK